MTKYFKGNLKVTIHTIQCDFCEKGFTLLLGLKVLVNIGDENIISVLNIFDYCIDILVLFFIQKSGRMIFLRINEKIVPEEV